MPKKRAKPADDSAKRVDHSTQVYLHPDIDLALRNYIQSHEVRPSKSRTVEAAVLEFLKARGFFPPKK